MKTDKDLIFEAYTKSLINEDLDDEGIDPDSPERDDFGPPDEPPVFERLEELMRKKPELKNDLKPILDEFEDIIKSIIKFDSVDGKIDESDLDEALYRLSTHALNMPNPNLFNK